MTRGTLFRLAAVTIVAAISLLLLEFGLRLVGYPRPAISGWRSDPSIPALEKNQVGFRGQPIAYSKDDYIVLLVGDSQVEAGACDFFQMPERRLQQHLLAGIQNARVFTLGCSGYGQDQELLTLKDYYRRNYRADLVLLWETPENDVWNNVFPTNWPADGVPKPTFWLQNGVLQGPSEEMEHDTNNPKLLALLRLALRISRDKAWERYLPKPYSPVQSYRGLVSELWQRRWDNGLIREENLASEKSHLAIRLTPRSPRMAYGLDLTNALLHEIRRLVESHGGRFLAFYRDYPGHWTVNSTSSGEEIYLLNGLYYRTSNEQYKQNIGYMNRGLEACFLPVTVKDWKVNAQDPHLNPIAIDQVMRDLAAIVFKVAKR